MNQKQAAQAAQDRLIDLVDRATRPPADLRLDWARFHANLAKEPMLRPAAGRRPRLWLTVRRVSLAAAAVLLLTTAFSLLPQRFGLDTNVFHWGQNRVATKGPENSPTPPSPVTPAAVEPTLAIGLTPEAARQVVAKGGMVVVFPRRAGEPVIAEAPVQSASSPMVLSNSAPLAGGQYADSLNDSENDAVFMSF